MKDINTYIKEGFYKNAGTKEYTEMLSTFEKIRTFIESKKDSIDVEDRYGVGFESLWEEFRSLFVKFPVGYGFFIACRRENTNYSYTYKAYVKQSINQINSNDINSRVQRRIFSLGGKDGGVIDLPTGNWRFSYTNTVLYNLFTAIISGDIKEIIHICPVKLSQDYELKVVE